MKTPLKYYGGKTRIAKWIISHFPKHEVYVEPFAGGLSVYFAKGEPEEWGVRNEAINDLDDLVYNFFKQLRDNHRQLMRAIDLTLFCRTDFELCRNIVKGRIHADDLERARAFYFCCNAGYAAKRDGQLRYCPHPSRKEAVIFANKLKDIKLAKERLKKTFIEKRDAIDFIKKWDGKDTLFYIDPPYPGADQAYLHKYTIENFNTLLATLKKIKGKFILSCYERKGMKFLKKWNKVYKKTTCHVADAFHKGNRTECLVMNYKQ